jgi:hypothetical protein
MNTSKKKHGGISIRVVNIAMTLCAIAIAVLLVIFSNRSSGVFNTLSSETGNYIVRQKAAHDLMEASDYLTENVQRFTLEADTKYMDQYFEEAYTSKRRESAVMTMSENNADTALIQQIQEALDESMELMYREYYAMKLVIDAKDIRTYPDTLRAIELTEEDQFLSAEAKMDKAQDMVMGREYYASKEIIRTKLKNSLEILDDQMAATRRSTNAEMMSELARGRTLVIVMIVVLTVLVGMIMVLTTSPLINAARQARKKERLDVGGTKEMRGIADSYNEMFDTVHTEEQV